VGKRGEMFGVCRAMLVEIFFLLNGEIDLGRTNIVTPDII
jgi:hypothetical protein